MGAARRAERQQTRPGPAAGRTAPPAGGGSPIPVSVWSSPQLLPEVERSLLNEVVGTGRAEHSVGEGETGSPWSTFTLSGDGTKSQYFRFCLSCSSFTRISVQSLSRVRLCDPMDCSTPGLPVHHQLPEFT